MRKRVKPLPELGGWQAPTAADRYFPDCNFCSSGTGKRLKSEASKRSTKLGRGPNHSRSKVLHVFRASSLPLLTCKPRAASCPLTSRSCCEKFRLATDCEKSCTANS